MTDKEKTIKELKEALDSLDITNKYRLNLIRAIEYLQEESVSEDLEEAALQHLSKHYDTSVIWDEDEKCVVRDFKAGAYWKEQQMMKDAMDVVIGNEWGHPRCVLTQYDLEPLGIRSKDRVKVIVIMED